MDKISGIIPSNARTRAGEANDSRPVRPGAPGWGRPQGRVTKANQGVPAETEVEDRVSLSEAQTVEKTPFTYKPSPDAMKVKIAESMATKFADINPKSVARESDLPASETLTESLSQT